MTGGKRVVGSIHKMTEPKSVADKWTFEFKVICPIEGEEIIMPAGSYVLDTPEEAQEHLKASVDDFLRSQKQSTTEVVPEAKPNVVEFKRK